MSDDFMNQFEPPKPPRPEFAAALYQRISQPMIAPTRPRVLRFVAVSLAMVAVIAALLILSPSARAFADSILQQFNVGGYIFVKSTPEPKPVQGTGSAENGGDFAGKPAAKSPEEIATKQAQGEEIATLQASKIQEATLQPNQDRNKQSLLETAMPRSADDAAAASQLAGFPVLAPSYLPDGYTADDQPGVWTVSHESNGVLAMISYRGQSPDDRLNIQEQMYQAGQPNTVLERPDIEQETVRGQPGAWMPADSGKNMLAWEENGITYLIVSNTLSKAEVLKIAESLAP